MGGNHTAKRPSVSFGVGVLEIRMPKNLTKKVTLHSRESLEDTRGSLAVLRREAREGPDKKGGCDAGGWGRYLGLFRVVTR